MYMRFKDGKDRAVTLSYDDGVRSDIRLIEIMKKYGLKGTFNINSGQYLPEDSDNDGISRRLKLSEAKEVYADPCVEVAVHSYTHPFLEELDDSEIVYEIVEDRKGIERDYGKITKGMAYPMGTYNDRVVNVLRNCGISYSRTTKSTERFRMPDNWLTLHPTCHHKNPRLMELAKKFIDGPNYGKNWMFYLWGHSYEFNNDNNWEVIEEFAEYIGGRDNIWYATNIEIYNYTKAYESLQTSYDKKMIYNPTSIDVWASIGGEVIKIPAGETVCR